jgi:hypothetical protein
MPVKLRTPKGRRPVFGDEVLDLFQRLSAMPKSERKSPESRYKEQSQRLAELLGLETEWSSVRMVENEPDRYPPHDNDFQLACFERVRDVRAALLAEVAKQRRH